MDLDGDGRTDVISGSWPGEVYFFRRQPDGKFAAAVQLKGHDGKAINVGSASAAFAADWDGDGAIDLVVGTVLGEVWLIPNEGAGKKLAFGTPHRLDAGDKPIKVSGDAAPVVADWDGDGKLDLIVGSEDGSVVWYRHVGSKTTPRLEAARQLVGISPLGWAGDDKGRPGDWGLRVKPCVADWNGDGRPDLLLGDRCGGFQGKPNQTQQEKEEERRANERLPELRKKWADAFQHYLKAQDTNEKHVRRTELQRLKDELIVVQEIESHYQPGSQCHGFVWLFLRNNAGEGKR